MPYTTLTLDQAVADLSRRLNETTGFVNFWSEEEKVLYINEALQTFGAATNFFRDTFPLDLVVDQVWYDISDSTANPATLRPQTITDTDLYTILEYHLLEPPTGATWTGSKQFNIEDLVGAVQRRRDQLLYEAGYQVNRTLYTAVDYDTILDQTTIDVRRVAWLPNDRVNFDILPLWRDDIWGVQSFVRNQSPSFDIPSTYRLSTTPPLTLKTTYKPITAGNYEVLSVNSGAVLSALTAPAILTIPNDFAWVIKWGALADMLSRESVARDPLRAQYCEMRYRQGLALLKSTSAVLAIEVEYVTMDLDAVVNGDNFNPTWQDQPSGVPTSIYIAGLNLIGLSPAPDATYELDVTVVQNTPLPATGADFLQVGREDYDAILDYAQHLAAFKQGGAEFTATIPLLNNFIRHVKLYNSKLNQLGEFTDVIYDQSQAQNTFFPITQPEAEEVE